MLSRANPPQAEAEGLRFSFFLNWLFMVALPDFPPGWHCYLLLCSDGSYYCGIASNRASPL
jgi:hypothetical protein